MIPGTALVLAFVAGGVPLALWAEARWQRAPRSALARALHLLASLVALQLAGPLMALVPGVESSAAVATAALVAIFLPAVAYAFVNAIWLVRLAQQSMLGA